MGACVGNGWAMQEELVSLLKTAGWLCLERHNETGKTKTDPLCANLTSFLKNTFAQGTDAADKTDRQSLWAGTTGWPDNVTWSTGDNVSWTNGSAVEQDPDYGNVFMAALSVILGIVILITVIGE
ncbi:hypothetical protein GE061_015854 [Apolygus lucorum]|uniref:Uncharacterized protein n=1 Tax=Apolygus lucorum TaxID=248454 RepID=A0A8S9XPE4_APOLU|nr:hypothetical protein GE061_015854 [Apolygus lucorum]